jgi:sugar transferase (PEP-CTERM/EpsH1 system associated)
VRQQVSARPARILHVVDNLGKGGLENGLANVIGGLAPDRYAHTVFVIRHLGKIANRLQGLAQIVHLDKKAGDSRFQIPDLVRIIRQVRPDIVHSRNWGAIESVVAARLVRVPAVIHSEHGLDAGEEPGHRRWLRRIAYELCDRVVSVSEKLLEHHAARTGFPVKRMTVIHNGVDMQRFRPDAALRAQARTELGFAPDDLCIAVVGNFTLVKDHMTLLRAVERFHRESRQPWRLVLFGTGPEQERLQSFVAVHPEWASRVAFPGLTDRIPQLLTAFDAYAITSLSEGLSNSLIEAMSAGLPVIATKTGGNPEVVVHGESGLLFPVGDDAALAAHLVAFAHDPALRDRLARGALARIKDKFSVESMVRNYGALYEGVLRPPRSRQESEPAERAADAARHAG